MVIVLASHALFVRGEIFTYFFAHVKQLVGGQTEAGTGGIGKLGTTFTVALAGAGNFGDTPTDFGLGDDELRLTGLGALGFVNGLGNGRDVVTVGERDHVPADRLEA